MKISQSINKTLSKVIYAGEKPHYPICTIANVLTIAALMRTSVNAVAGSPNADTVFLRCREGLRFEDVEDILKKTRPRIKGKVTIAIDGHDEMFYGDKHTKGVIGTREKAGSYHAFKYLCVKLIGAEKAYFVCLARMENGSVVDAAIDSMKELAKAYDIGLVLMDGEFFCGRMLRFLDKMKIHFIIRRRSIKRLLDSVTYGKAVRCRTREKLRTDRPDTVEAGYCLYRYHGRGGRDFFLASDIMAKPERLRKTFKKRWEIETGFREVNRLKIKTLSKDWRIRMLFYAISMMLYNEWVSARCAGAGWIRLDEFKRALFTEVRKAVNRLKICFKLRIYPAEVIW